MPPTKIKYCVPRSILNSQKKIVCLHYFPVSMTLVPLKLCVPFWIRILNWRLMASFSLPVLTPVRPRWMTAHTGQTRDSWTNEPTSSSFRQFLGKVTTTRRGSPHSLPHPALPLIRLLLRPYPLQTLGPFPRTPTTALIPRMCIPCRRHPTQNTLKDQVGPLFDPILPIHLRCPSPPTHPSLLNSPSPTRWVHSWSCTRWKTETRRSTAVVWTSCCHLPRTPLSTSPS